MWPAQSSAFRVFILDNAGFCDQCLYFFCVFRERKSSPNGPAICCIKICDSGYFLHFKRFKKRKISNRSTTVFPYLLLLHKFPILSKVCVDENLSTCRNPWTRNREPTVMWLLGFWQWFKNIRVKCLTQLCERMSKWMCMSYEQIWHIQRNTLNASLCVLYLIKSVCEIQNEHV